MFRILRYSLRALLFTISSGLLPGFVLVRLTLPGASLPAALAVTAYLVLTAPIGLRLCVLAARLLDAAFPDGLAA